MEKRKAGRDHGSNWAAEEDLLLTDEFLVSKDLPVCYESDGSIIRSWQAIKYLIHGIAFVLTPRITF